MCGFVGLIEETEKYFESLSALEPMTDAIAHRGPDDTGYYTEAPIALGHRRLSILDIEGGKQPMISSDGKLVLVFNGEIYNYPELRAILLQKGYAFRTKCDSEVLLHGYAEYGIALPRYLRGMFAFAIWDKQKKRLFAARDLFGIKPFYYTQMGSTFLFGSEIKSFLMHPSFEKRFNRKLLPGYLSFQYTPPCAETFFEDVYRLSPAHTLSWEKGNLTVSSYDDLQFDQKSSENISSVQWTDRIESVLVKSVQVHKLSDVEVYSFLSSGVDSSYIAALSKVNKTFTVGFDIVGGAYSEIEYAKELSREIGAVNISKVIRPDEYWNAVEQVQYYMDEPLADPSAVALYFLCQLASQHCKVVLSGEGADELFGGYNIYREPMTWHAYEWIPFPLRHKIAKLAKKLPAHRGLNFLIRKGERLEDRYIGNAYIFSFEEAQRLLKDSTLAPAPTEFTHPIYAQMQANDPSTRMQTLDLHTWLVGDILQKADKMSMAHSLELRVPFLDKEVWEIAHSLSLRERTNRKETKIALRRAARRCLPERWASKKKLGFPVPIRVWLREDIYCKRVIEVFNSHTAQYFFDSENLQKLLIDHQQGLTDNSRKIYTVYAFLLWYRKFFES